jgi:hypothetical protein
MVISVSSSEKLFIGEGFNGHVGTIGTKFEMVHENFGYDDKNQEGE